jgi:hypothetical protein
VKALHESAALSFANDCRSHDLSHAVCRNSQPLFVQVGDPTFRGDSSFLISSSEPQERYWDSPLFSLGETLGLGRIAFLPHDLRAVLLDLAAAFEMRHIETQCTSSATSTPLQSFADIVRRRLQHLVASHLDPSEAYECPFARACQLGAVIFFRAVTDLLPFDSFCNKSAMEELEAILRQNRLEQWRFLPYTYQWL